MTMSSIGGSAAQRGITFENRVAAWAAVQVLAEACAPRLWGYHQDDNWESICCQTGYHVDDLLINTSRGGRIFVQVKLRLTLARTCVSSLASSLDQAARQGLALDQSSGPAAETTQTSADRIVLIAGPSSSQGIQSQLPQILARLREQQAEPLSDIAGNRSEAQVLSVVLGHIRESWRQATGAESSDQDLLRVLSRLYVHVLDLSDDGADRQTTELLLRSAVLHDPAQAAESWCVLVEYCSQLAARRTGADRRSFQRLLLRKGIPLRSPRGYENDIQSLRCHSERMLRTLSHLAELNVPNDQPPVRIERECLERLYVSGQEQHLLVIGEPGAGKSGVLHALSSRARDDECDFLLMSADRIISSQSGLLDSPLEHHLEDVLANWFSDGPGLLIIDALDAARSEDNARKLRDLIRAAIQGQSRWRVVAAIRQFDLRYSDDLKELFAGPAIDQATSHPEFDSVHHLFVQKLSDGEIEQVRQQSTDLASIIDNASPELGHLLRSPFNLRLVTSLLATGMSEADLTSLQTQIDLLERYWLRRVHDCRGEEVLRPVCEIMVNTRELRVDLSEIAPSANADQLQALLSNHVLQEWQRSPESRPNDQMLAFSHHMLFDYAVARLLLGGRPEQSIERLAAEPDLVLAIRPSVMWHFRRLWTEDARHEAFWSQVLGMCAAADIPAAGAVVGPAVAVELGHTVDDFDVLTRLLLSATGTQSHVSVQVYVHLVGALHAITPEIPIMGEEAGPWCELVARVTQQLDSDLARASQSLLCSLCDKPEQLTATQMEHAGEAARRLFEFAEGHQHDNSWLMVRAIQNVCKTFASSPQESAAMLRRLLAAGRMQSHGYEEIPAIAREIKRLIPHDVALVADIYRAAFAYDERSDDITPIGAGRILPLTSTRSQDYRMGTYELRESFSQFLQADPIQSTDALLDIVNHYIDVRHTPSGNWPDAVGDFDGVPCTIRTDLSHIWDEGHAHRDDDALGMLTEFEQYVRSIGSSAEHRSLLGELVQLFAGRRCAAVLWRRLLLAGAERPDVLGLRLKSICWNRAMLKHIDTSRPAGKLLQAVYPQLGEAERKRVEDVILAIPEGAAPDERDGLDYVRNRLLGCLSGHVLATQIARDLLAELQRDQQVPPNDPVFQLEEGWAESPSQDRYFAEQGVDIESDTTKRLLSMIEPLKGLADKYLNAAPGQQEAMDVLEPIRTLMAELAEPAEELRPVLLDSAWDAMVSACERIARADNLPEDEGLRLVLKQVFLRASTCDSPRPDPEADQAFDEHFAWSSPAPRVDAAQGLMALAGHPGLADGEITAAIERLSADPKPQVRFQIAERIIRLYYTAPDVMWQIVDKLGREELSRGVLWSLCVRGLHPLARGHADRVVPLIKPIMDRASDGPGAGRVIEACMSMVVGLHVWQGNDDCCSMLDAILADTPCRIQELRHAASCVREALMHGETDPSNLEECRLRQRAFKVLEDILARAHVRVRELRSQGETHGWSEDVLNELRPLMQLLDQIGSTVYFASETRDRTKPPSDEAQGPTHQQQERFYQESKGLVQKLAHVGVPSVTHHLVELLEYFIPSHPVEVFLAIGEIICAGQSAGYQYESMAAGRVVKLVERYLAEYRWVFRQEEGCRRSLLSILDIFVYWPAAHRLTYRLAEIYR